MSELASPTPMIEPISVCELEAGRPRVPGAEVPDDRGDQQREDHREAGAGADLEDQFDRQQGEMAKATAAGRVSTPRKFQKPDQMTATGGLSVWV